MCGRSFREDLHIYGQCKGIGWERRLLLLLGMLQRLFITLHTSRASLTHYSQELYHFYQTLLLLEETFL